MQALAFLKKCVCVCMSVEAKGQPLVRFHREPSILIFETRFLTG